MAEKQEAPINILSESEIDLALEALDMLENQPGGIPGFENGFAGYVVGGTEADIRTQVEQKVKEVKIELRDRKRRIVLLKAKLIQASMNLTANDLFTVKLENES
jgi:hypothetical protein